MITHWPKEALHGRRGWISLCGVFCDTADRISPNPSCLECQFAVSDRLDILPADFFERYGGDHSDGEA